MHPTDIALTTHLLRLLQELRDVCVPFVLLLFHSVIGERAIPSRAPRFLYFLLRHEIYAGLEQLILRWCQKLVFFDDHALVLRISHH